MSRGYSVAQTARLVCALRWTCSRLAEMLDAWARQSATVAAAEPQAGGPHAAASVRLAELSGRLVSHRETLDGFQPDSELMAGWRQAAPNGQPLVAALDEIAGLEGPRDRVAVAEEVLVAGLSGAYRQIDEHAAPHCDAALASAARTLKDHLDAALASAAGAPGGDLDGEAEPVAAGPSGAVEAAARVLSAAGGIVGSSVLRPQDWT